MPSTMNFPKVFAAVAACRDAMAAHLDNIAVRDAPTERDQVHCLLAARRSWAVCTEGRDAAYFAYATELLPAILPGTPWAHGSPAHLIGDHDASLYGGTDIPDLWSCPRLLDHPAIFRRHGSHGPTTWNNALQIGEPYWTAPDADAVDEAEYLSRFGLGVWHRLDMSSWFPGWTSLVIVAPGLRPQDARRFGFTALGGAAADESVRAA